MSVLTFRADRTFLEGKQGKLKTDGKGTYECIVGAYNATNNVGETYTYTQRVANLFKNSTAVRKLNNSQLYGEADHPSLDEYYSKSRSRDEAISLWISRLSRIDPKSISHQITGLDVVDSGKKNNGRPVMLVKAQIKPLNEVLKACMLDPDNNTAFSVRSFVDRSMKLGEIFCEAKDIITWDWVPTGGISHANKYNTPSLESEHKPNIESKSVIITDGVLAEYELLERNYSGLESDITITSQMIKNFRGQWQEVPNLDNLFSRNW